MTNHLRSQPPSRSKQEGETERKGQGFEHGQILEQGLGECQERSGKWLVISD